MERLPKDILLKIALLLPIKDALSLSYTCKKCLNSISKNKNFWLNIAEYYDKKHEGAKKSTPDSFMIHYDYSHKKLMCMIKFFRN